MKLPLLLCTFIANYVVDKSFSSQKPAKKEFFRTPRTLTGYGPVFVM